VARTKTARTDRKGVSLAKGPIALLGLAMIAFGVIAFLMGGDSFTTNSPDGPVTGDTFLGLEGNGWTNALWVAGGLLLVLAAPMHWGAKTMAIIVGLALAAAAIISLVDGPGVFGVLAANDMTELVWGAVAVGLLILALLPRVGRKKHVEHERDGAVVERDHERRHVDPVEREAYERGRRDAERERTGAAGTAGTERTSRFGRDRHAAREDERVVEDERTVRDDRTAVHTDEAAERDRGGFRRL
jgi:hypothetical protein